MSSRAKFGDRVPKFWAGSCPPFRRFLAAGLLALFPFQDLLDPLGLIERVHPTTHLEKRWKTFYDQPLGNDQISFQWLGTTGFKIQKGNFVLLIDPYLTRVPLPQLYLEPLQSNTKLLEEKIPKADYIFITDSHFDHFLDTPSIAMRTGAKVVGSPNTAKLLRLHGVPESQIVQTKGGETLLAGPFTVKVAKAVHGTIWFLRPFYGDVDPSAKPPLRVWGYANLENRCYHFSIDGFRFFVSSGADLDEKEIDNFRSDLVMVNVTTLPGGYTARLLRATQPKVVFPTHYDNFFRPFSDGVQPFPIVDLKIFCQEVENWNPPATPVTLDFFQEYRVTLTKTKS